MNRRHFLQSMAALTTGVAASGFVPPRGGTDSIMTVRGRIAPRDMGLTLPHEHVLVDFTGAEDVRPPRYDRDRVFEVVLPHLQEVYRLGGRTMAECTPAYLARDPALLQRLSRASGLHLLTNTGYYGARSDQHVPQHAFSDTTDALAARWISEWRKGIGDTDIRPGFIKIGVDGGTLSDIDRKLIRAAARTHRATGLTIAAHTGPAVPAFEQLEVLAEEKVHPSAWIWVHAQGEQDATRHVEAARHGAWVEFDGIHPDGIGRYVELVRTMKQHGLLDRVLISQDAGWYHVGEPGGGSFRPYTTLMTSFLPRLKEAGFTNAELHRLVVSNPARAFTVRRRTA